MIEGNRIKLGYGDIAVGAYPIRQAMYCYQTRQCHEYGDNVIRRYDFDAIGDGIEIVLANDEEYCLFRKLLEDVKCRRISEFTFKGYIFDFSNYNEISVQVWIEYASLVARSNYIICCAC